MSAINSNYTKMNHDQVLVPLVALLRAHSQIALTYPTILYRLTPMPFLTYLCLRQGTHTLHKPWPFCKTVPMTTTTILSYLRNWICLACLHIMPYHAISCHTYFIFPRNLEVKILLDFLRIKPEHPDVAPPRSPRRFFAVPSVRWSLASGDQLQ